MASNDFELPKLKCMRCYHIWIPRKEGSLPKFCPKCKSPYWNKLRVSEMKILDDGGIHTFAKELK